MAEAIPVDEQTNYETFRDCLSEPVLKALAAPAEKPRPRKKRHAKKNSKEKTSIVKNEKNNTISNRDAQSSDAEDLGEFIEVHPPYQPCEPPADCPQYLSSVIFPCLPAELRNLTYPKFRDSTSLQDSYSTPLSASTYTRLLELISPDAMDSLESYGLLPSSSDTTDQRNLLLPVFNTYATAVTAPPPIWVTTRTTECELCLRDWVPLTYHHLIPKSAHARVMKRGWHTEDKLNSVAWLCRACHSFVHRLASNEGLAKSYYTVDLIIEGGTEGDVDKKNEVEGWVKWVGGVRWRSR
jgi:hypothetical protein